MEEDTLGFGFAALRHDALYARVRVRGVPAGQCSGSRPPADSGASGFAGKTRLAGGKSAINHRARTTGAAGA